jgi:DNA-binding NarL/FixJ family response regulator
MNVLIVDDHPVVIAGCRALFDAARNIDIIDASDERSGYRAFCKAKPDVTVIDVNLPGLSGFELLKKIMREDSEARVIMFSMNDDPAFAVRAMEGGAKGYVSKNDDPDLLVQAVRNVARGKTFVTPRIAKRLAISSSTIRANPGASLSSRELEILRLLGRGNKILEIAIALDLSYKTVANVTSEMKRKLEAKNHSDLVRISVEMGL